jgi:hypothetical protein
LKFSRLWIKSLRDSLTPGAELLLIVSSRFWALARS